MEIFERRSPAYVQVVKGVEDGDTLVLGANRVYSEITVMVNGLYADTTPTGLTAEVDGEGDVAATHYFKVTAVINDGETMPSKELEVEMLEDSTIEIISWDAVEGATGYFLYNGVDDEGTIIYETAHFVVGTSIDIQQAEAPEEKVIPEESTVPTESGVAFGLGEGFIYSDTVEDGYASTQYTSIVTPSEDAVVDVTIEVGSADLMLRYYESYLEPTYILEEQ